MVINKMTRPNIPVNILLSPVTMLRSLQVFLCISVNFIYLGVSSHKLEIAKCCAENEIILVDFQNNTQTCKSYVTNMLIFSNITVYDKNHDHIIPDKSFFDIFRIEPDKRPNISDFDLYYDLEYISKTYLTEDGLLYMENPNAYARWIPINNSEYCVDFKMIAGEDIVQTSFWCGYLGEPPKPTNSFFPAALLVSVVFLILVLVVYMLIPSLQNLGGMVLIAYCLSLLLAFLSLAIIQIFRHDTKSCIALTTIVYFGFLSSFCWMTVMSYDIWWTFRGYAKARPIHRRGENFKFYMYCLFAWGIPLAMSIAFVVINSLDLSHIPWFIKPQIPDMGCFLEGGQKLVYLYTPMLILILCNWMFFLMTAFNIWRLHRGTAVLDSPAAGTPQAHRNQRNRLMIYLKLSIIMGINWILEVVSSLTPEFDFWYISDAYNLLIGLAIFLIFVCKKKIYRNLKARFTKNRLPRQTLTKSQTSSTTLSAVSQDTPLQVIHHPNGISKRNN